MFSTHSLSIGYKKRRHNVSVQQHLDLQLRGSELVCLIGPNGCGKSTLLRTLAGLQPPLAGAVAVDGKNIFALSAHEKSLVLSTVLTEYIDIENTTVRQIVAMGRQPHTSWWGALSRDDRAKTDSALQLVHLQDKADIFINELSDGERQRTFIAKALAQDTPHIFLDEPTAHLDLPNRIEIMLLLHELAHKTGKAILLSTHELDIALQAADRIWLMDKNLAMKTGVPEDLVIDGSFGLTFNNPHYYFNTSNGNFSMNYPLNKDISIAGESTRLYWTLRALARNGFRATQNAHTKIEVTEKGWVLDGICFDRIESLLTALKM
ncbi:MAG: ABC transporter ATP-binding protein [Prevotellaceae bacterium]|jgi:iron complex transport system ATP-binding protein|nr:ABC transporter ATP-binding protein [Prevotellaceae bacterium]